MSKQQTLSSFFGKRKRIDQDDRIQHKTRVLEGGKGGCRMVPVGHDGTLTKVICADNQALKRKLIEKLGEKRGKKVFEDVAPKAINSEVSSKNEKLSQPCFKKPISKIPMEQKVIKEGNQMPASKNSDVVMKNARDLIKRLQQKKLVAKTSTNDVIKAANDLVQKKKEDGDSFTSMGRKELSLGQVKKKLLISSRLDELKEKMQKFKEMSKTLDTPKIDKFDTLEFEIPPSPTKSRLYSPVKSPIKPAYQRFASLAEASTSLTLPYCYQKLYDMFCSVDTVCSMLVNRGENVTFNKLKPAVQEMTRKNFTERHLAQMASVLPDAFNFRQEKLRNFGSTSKVDRYELVVTPNVKTHHNLEKTPTKVNPDDLIRDAEKAAMSPKIIKERRDNFYKVLMEKTKDYHEEFLKTLEPPLVISRNELKRWHPNFMVDHVPDIIPSELPQPPYSDKACSAKDVLERANNFLNNQRLHKALETTANQEHKTDLIENVVEKQKTPIVDPLLKGVPQALLEKIRARQAAKAKQVMTQTPVQEKESFMLTRLPDIARILRTCYINEQKSVLSWSTLVAKIKFSSKLNISNSEVDDYLKLLIKTCPDWLKLQQIRNEDYIRIDKAVNVGLIMNRLDKKIT